MSDRHIITIEQIIPGGILPTDHLHRRTNDNTCSRCRWPVPNDEAPLLLWQTSDNLLIYCQTCLDIPQPAMEAAND